MRFVVAYRTVQEGIEGERDLHHFSLRERSLCEGESWQTRPVYKITARETERVYVSFVFLRE